MIAKKKNKKPQKPLCEQVEKTMYGGIRKIIDFNLPVKYQFDLFDRVIPPVLLYGCKIWD